MALRLQPSIRRQLIFWLVLPLSAALICSALVVYKLASDFVTEAYDRALYDYFAARVPDEVRDARSFDAWYREAAKKDAKLLFLARADLMRHGAESVTEELFPRQLRMSEAVFPLAYRFEPGHPLDAGWAAAEGRIARRVGSA